MKLLVVTLAPTLKKDSKYHSYAPYVKEMNLWFNYAEIVQIVSPTVYKKTLLTAPFEREDLAVTSIPWISFSSLSEIVKLIWAVPLIFLKLLGAMRSADHIHLRCPGTISLIGCVAQVFFPKKKKTAKYAGNWDPNSKQPWSYQIQKWILSNTFLTRNMQVLVYGEWPRATKNIKPFFTASYLKKEVPGIVSKAIHAPFSFVFVGSLAIGKRPLYAIQLVEKLHKNGMRVQLDLYGDGEERATLEKYVLENTLSEQIKFRGNQSAKVVKQAYKNAHFLMLPSQSEGWPKVVAEAMFWGVIPLVTPVSCVPWMLGNGARGMLLNLDLEDDMVTITEIIQNQDRWHSMSKHGQAWAQQYTLDDFETGIKKLLQ